MAQPYSFVFCQTGAPVDGSVRSQGRGENDKAIFRRRPEQRCYGFAQAAAPSGKAYVFTNFFAVKDFLWNDRKRPNRTRSSTLGARA
jgi:hypothetical protein